MDGSKVKKFKGIISEKVIANGYTLDKAYQECVNQAKDFDFYNENKEYMEKAYQELRDIPVEYISEGGFAILEDRKEWYFGPKDSDIFWPALKKYLLEDKEWRDFTVRKINRSSTSIIQHLDNPGLNEFKTKGLVVGYVQSGKTANMTAVMAKAADASFRFFIVLSGLTDALRNQTQERFENDLVKRNPAKWQKWTNIGTDFNLRLSSFPSFSPDQRNIAVIKKNKHILSRLIGVLKSTPPAILKSCPFMVIDDECDQASVNSAKFAEEMSAINESVRTLLKLLPRVAYIGYTATPFANILINPVLANPEHPDDLYPKDFIYSLEKPEEYFGAESLFGRDILEGDEVHPEEEGLDMIRLIPDEESPLLRPQKKKDRDSFSFEITSTLRKSLLYFILATAVRKVRGDENCHSSMLIHTTIYKEPHFSAQQRIEEFLEWVQNKLIGNDQKIFKELKQLWDEERNCVPAESFGNRTVEFDDLWNHVPETVGQIEVVVENSESEERLDFSSRTRRYIVVGGNVLARGLTIEGLIVSFFMRTSTQYDSIMQMGRWFGYRNKFEDLPRIWMTRDMRNAFHDLATVEAEIRQDIEIYARDKLTPMQFAVRIRQLPGLAITARTKMMAAQAVSVSYSDSHVQTFRFKEKDGGWLDKNWKAGSELINSVKSKGINSSDFGRGPVFLNVPVGLILNFIESYEVHETHNALNKVSLINYIEDQNRQTAGDLKFWNLGVLQPSSGAQSQENLGSLGKVRTIVRSRLKDGGLENDADIKALMSKADVFIDVDDNIKVSEKGWAELRNERENKIGKKPLLIFYPINSESTPVSSKNREPLNAMTDVLGLGFVFPKATDDTQIYVQVPLPEQDYEEPDIPEDINGEQ